MGRNSKYKSTRAVATARSFNPKINPESFSDLSVEDNDKLWNSINNTRDEILKKYGYVFENPENYSPVYPNEGLYSIEDIKYGRPDFVRANQNVKDVLGLLQKTTYGELDKNTERYVDAIENSKGNILKTLPANKDIDRLFGLQSRNAGMKDLMAPLVFTVKSDFIRTPYWDSKDKNNPEYKQFYKGTKDVSDRIIKYVNKRCSVLLPEEQHVKDVYFLQELQKVMVNSINELNNSRLPWNRSYKYNNQAVEYNYKKTSELIGADEKIFSKLKSPDINIDNLRKSYNNAKNAILSEISTQQKIASMSQNAVRQSVKNTAENFYDAYYRERLSGYKPSQKNKLLSEKDIADTIDALRTFQYGNVDDEVI